MGGIFFWGGYLTPFFFCANLLVRVKLGYPPNFNFLGKPLLGEKYVEGRKKERRRRKKEEEKETKKAEAQNLITHVYQRRMMVKQKCYITVSDMMVR